MGSRAYFAGPSAVEELEALPQFLQPLLVLKNFPHNLISKVDGSGRYNVMTTGSTGLKDQGVGLEAQNLISLLGRRQVEIGVPHHPAHRGACLQETARVRTGESAFGYRSYIFYGSGLKVLGCKV